MSSIMPMKPSDIRTSSPTAVRTVSVERTYLALPTPDAFRPGGAPAARAQLRALPRHDLAAWRALYATVGAAWQWHDRDAWPDAQLAEHLARDEVGVWAVDLPADTAHAESDAERATTSDRDVGMLELCRHDDGSVEIVYLGLVNRVHGRGLGAWLLGEAVRMAFAWNAARVWLHTCTLDGPAALPNYLARGFVVERTETYEAELPA
jgi:GNAT superfamily N-acetyltransferase